MNNVVDFSILLDEGKIFVDDKWALTSRTHACDCLALLMKVLPAADEEGGEENGFKALLWMI